MKLARICIFVSFAVLAPTNAADAATLGAGAFVTGGGAFDNRTGDPARVGVEVSCNVSACQDRRSKTTTSSQDSVDAVANGAASFGQALMSADVTAHAQPGDLGISIIGLAGAGADQSRAVFSANGFAEWRDVVRLTTGQAAIAGGVIVNSYLTLDGELAGSATGEGDVGAFLQIRDLSSFPGLPPAPFPASQFARLLLNPKAGINTSDDIPGAIQLRQFFRNGQNQFLGFSLDLTGAGRSDSDSNSVIASEAGTALLNADVSGSLHWGGIESVTDELGNPIDDWTITSESGFDYSKPFGVPEPTSILLMVTALLATLALSRQPRTS